jgi:hypothetical protein
MASSCDFRRYSANCLAFAENVSNPDDKARLIEMTQVSRTCNQTRTKGFAVNGDDAGESH